MPASQTLMPPIDAPSINRIGRFHILRELGRGIVGAVYLAHDPVIDRKVAIKTFNPGLHPIERKQHAEEFINEARAAGRLAHPGIVTIFDASTENGTAWIAMEYLAGETLGKLLEQKKHFRPEDIASILWRAADALDHAHQNGVIHRDVKPANIFVDDKLRPVLVDFGIARSPDRISSAWWTTDQAYTLSGNNLLGTPHYMSPEQALGQQIDARTDIYSVGVVMYEMLCGQKPYPTDNWVELVEMLRAKSPQAPHRINPSVPVELSRIAMKAMAKRPSARYQRAEDMVQDLRRYLIRQRRKRPLSDIDDPITNSLYSFSNLRLPATAGIGLTLLLTVAGFWLLS
jgi:serine/threonine protein kinase